MKIIEVNLLSAFLSIKLLSQKAKFSHKLKIVNIASIYGVITPDFKIYSKGDRFSPEVYGASKGTSVFNKLLCESIGKKKY